MTQYTRGTNHQGIKRPSGEVYGEGNVYNSLKLQVNDAPYPVLDS